MLKKHVIETLHTYAVFFRDGEFDQLREGIDNIESLSAFMLNDKNFELSDQIRDELIELGIQLNDDKNSSSYELF